MNDLINFIFKEIRRCLIDHNSYEQLFTGYSFQKHESCPNKNIFHDSFLINYTKYCFSYNAQVENIMYLAINNKKAVQWNNNEIVIYDIKNLEQYLINLESKLLEIKLRNC